MYLIVTILLLKTTYVNKWIYVKAWTPAIKYKLYFLCLTILYIIVHYALHKTSYFQAIFPPLPSLSAFTHLLLFWINLRYLYVTSPHQTAGVQHWKQWSDELLFSCQQCENVDMTPVQTVLQWEIRPVQTAYKRSTLWQETDHIVQVESVMVLEKRSSQKVQWRLEKSFWVTGAEL